MGTDAAFAPSQIFPKPPAKTVSVWSVPILPRPEIRRKHAGAIW